ncbi:hypothetical protein ACFYY1_30140 [Streptomyces sp. NPDC001890]|uniref:hypothetical protein n=1 Tax=Streptomyces sp. NPDC001890 TaxID=3364620 RepID=UPI0036C81EE8
MADNHLDENARLARLRVQGEERRRRGMAATLRLERQERQAHEEAHQAEASQSERQQYAQLPQPSYTGIR